MPLSENGLTAPSDVYNACRPCYPGHYNDRAVNLGGITGHTIESKGNLGPSILSGSKGTDSGILGVDWINQSSVQSSVHAGSSYAERVFCLSLDKQCWGAGSHANGSSWQVEQAGDASMSRDEWLAPNGLGVIKNTAMIMADMIQIAKRDYGVTIPVRIATDQQVLDFLNGGQPFGIVPHSTWARLFPQDTTHSDWGDGYPTDVLLSEINKILNPSSTPAKPQGDTNDMADITDAQMQKIADKVIAGLGFTPGKVQANGVPTNRDQTPGHCYYDDGTDAGVFKDAVALKPQKAKA